MKTVTLDSIFQDAFATVDDKSKQKPPVWVPTSKYWNLMKLTPDGLGQFGEAFAVKALEQLGTPYTVTWSPGTSNIKEYDVLTTNQLTRISLGTEIKSATLGESAKSFQHENIDPDRAFDAILFMDFGPDDLYATFLTKVELPYNHCEPNNPLLPHPGPIHERPNGCHKWDFKLPGPRSKQNGVQMNRVSTVAEFLTKYRAMETRFLAQQAIINPPNVSFTPTPILTTAVA